jgi:hypothetical protein
MFLSFVRSLDSLLLSWANFRIYLLGTKFGLLKMIQDLLQKQILLVEEDEESVAAMFKVQLTV